jgi:hypothetical protein
MIFFRRLYFSFPVRMLVFHIRNNLILIFVWMVLAMFSTGQWGRFFGLHYLMLTPEYRGEVNFWSFFITGAAFGALMMIWNLTTYLLCSSRFPFLASLRAPFTKFCINNSLIPLLFLNVYLAATIWFQAHNELIRRWEIAWNVGGFLCGTAALVGLLAFYLYFTNKDIGAFLRPRKFIARPGGRILVPGQRLPTIGEIQSGLTRWRVDSYLNERLRPRRVRSVAHYNAETLEQVFRQNHWNAVVVQLGALLVLLFLGLFMDEEWARIPTGASVFVLGSMVMALFGAINFWFRTWSTLVFIGLMLMIDIISGWGYLNYRNRAYGLDYKPEKRGEYSYKAFEAMCDPGNITRDKAETLKILERWLAKNRTPEQPKPKLVFVCVSGGGMRSALWVMQTLQQADRSMNGKLLRQTALITGASGGMLGAAYLRELKLRRLYGAPISEYDPAFAEDISKDLLNPVGFAVIANDLFFPMSTFKSGGFEYRKDRGYLFERQLNENCRGYLSRRLAEYRRPEAEAKIPMMIVSPYVLNDARRLLISPQGVSYLMKPQNTGRLADQVEIDGVDFGKLFGHQNADSLAFTSALRMNCTYPLILPNVWLPTNPAVEGVDAGFRDNYGIGLATRFAHVFRSWILENTGGVVIVQIRCFEKIDGIVPSDTKGLVEALLTPAGAAGNLTVVQDYELDNTLALLYDALGPGKLEVLRFSYRPVRKQREASMSLHLSKREKIDLLEAFFSEENKKTLRALKQTLR